MIQRLITLKQNQNMFRFLYSAAVIVVLYSMTLFAYAHPISVVAAENMYGDIARQLGGDAVKVDIILNNPDQDPHLFELTASVGTMIHQADLVIINGLGYDGWIDRLLTKHHFKPEQIISIQSLLHRQDGDNPHLWYDLQSAKMLSVQLEKSYSRINPQQQSFFIQQLNRFNASLSPLELHIQKIRNMYPNIRVAATEPVFGLMAHQLGFIMQEEPYQWSVMNGGEPTPRQVAQFEQDLKIHQIQILFYNEQVVTPATEQLKKIAQQAHVPLVGVSEMMPPHLTYQEWIAHVLDQVETALKSIPQ